MPGPASRIRRGALHPYASGAQWRHRFWQVTGERISCLENQCRTGAIYCQLVEAARPGAVDMRKVNLRAGDNNALNNYKALEAALTKIGLEEARSVDIQKLAAGQPQATLELLQTLHAALVTEDASETPRAGRLATLDPNALEGGVSSRKRKAALQQGAGARPQRKARGGAKVDEQMQAAESVPEPPPTTAEPAVASAGEATLQAELERTRALLAESRAEAQHLREEASFYYAKLERIENACSCASPAKAPAEVLRILYEPEAEGAAEAEGADEIAEDESEI